MKRAHNENQNFSVTEKKVIALAKKASLASSDMPFMIFAAAACETVLLNTNKKLSNIRLMYVPHFKNTFTTANKLRVPPQASCVS